MKRASSVVAVAALALAALVARGRFGGEANRRAPPLRQRVAAVTESALATRAAMGVLAKGGAAADAAIAAALVSGVVEPASSGIGGGGFALVWDAKAKHATFLDFREVAPAAVERRALELRTRPPLRASRGAFVGVPGEVAGLVELHRRFGKLPLADLVAPAADLAERGFVASPHLAREALAFHAELTYAPLLVALFKPGGFAARAGARLANPRLGATLRRIGAEGRRAFYSGPVADDLVLAAREAGSPMTAADLEAYRVIEREPLRVAWEGLDVVTAPPPSGGGLLVAETLGMHTKAELRALAKDEGAFEHVLAESFRGAIADRTHFVGDPGVRPVDVGALLEPSRLAARRREIDLFATRPANRIAVDEAGTSHLATVDDAGDVVLLTTTVNDAFGAFAIGASSGVLLNDELADFTSEADLAKVDPATASAAPNRPEPGARPASSMTPTLVLDRGEPVVALGASGGFRIATSVAQALARHLALGASAGTCVRGPRFHPVAVGPELEIEASLGDDVATDLERRGEIPRRGTAYSGLGMIAWVRDARGGLVLDAVGDPRKGGLGASE